MPDTESVLYLSGVENEEQEADGSEACLTKLQGTWSEFTARPDTPENIWVEDLDTFLNRIAYDRIALVKAWLDVNMARFKTDTTHFESIRRSFEGMAVSLRANIQLCKLQCGVCQLLCIRRKYHSGSHQCGTSHQCPKPCDYSEKTYIHNEVCGLP